MAKTEVFGASAAVRIRFDGSLGSLAEKLRVALSLPSFTVEPSEYPPHQEVGSAEVLGWELWLEADKARAGVFELRMSTEHALQEIAEGRMHDLSAWLARFLAMMCDLKVTSLPSDSVN